MTLNFTFQNVYSSETFNFKYTVYFYALIYFLFIENVYVHEHFSASFSEYKIESIKSNFYVYHYLHDIKSSHLIYRCDEKISSEYIRSAFSRISFHWSGYMNISHRKCQDFAIFQIYFSHSYDSFSTHLLFCRIRFEITLISDSKF